MVEPGTIVRALYDYTGATEAELSFYEGDKIIFCSSERGWAKGELRNIRGWFPITYIEPVRRMSVSGPPVPKRRTDTAKVESASKSDSIIADKARISALLDSWLSTRVNLNEPRSRASATSKKKSLLRYLMKDRNPVFNIPLAELAQYGTVIPHIVTQCAEYLSHPTEDRIIVEGLFRVPGSKDKSQKLLSEFKDASERIVFRAPHPHTVASVFKTFFQQLPEAVVPPEYSQSMLKAMTNSESEQDRISFFKAIIMRLPSANGQTFVYLINFLHEVAKHSNVNQMHAKNLGIVWGPTSMRPAGTDTASMMSHNETCCEIIEILIRNWHAISEQINFKHFI